MVKSILAVIVGYIAMAIFAFAVCTCAYLGLGVERAFQPESYEVSTIWIVILIAVALIGGIIGGLVCVAISKSKGACTGLVVLVLVVGVIAAIMTGMKEHSSAPRSGDVSSWKAMELAQTPGWLCYVNPVLGAVGVMLGARMKKLPAA
jgi:peptidoglycan/LPS O-acetylase OafA/YrhL